MPPTSAVLYPGDTGALPMDTRFALCKLLTGPFIPMLFMVVMTLVASWELFWLFSAKAVATPSEAFTYRLDSALVAVMAVLAVVAMADSAVKWVGLLSGNTIAALDPEGE